jgi:hypothetical protein
MPCNTSVGSLPFGLARVFRRAGSATLSACMIALSAIALLTGTALHAQQGSGTIKGTVADKSAAVIKGAKVTITNTDTGVQNNTITNNSGDYTFVNVQAGHYNLEVVGKGFQRLLQEDVTVDSGQSLGLNLTLTIGADSQTVTITTAPTPLNTQDASLGGTIENELYSQLPLSMGGNPRDPTAFAFLMPGVLESSSNATGTGNGTQSGTYGGSGAENLNENYIEGVPVTNIGAQGDPTQVRGAVSVDAVDQFSVTTNGASTGFGGVGVTNYTIKAGGNSLHGSVFDYIRNTAFDTWGYFAKAPTGNGYATKPGEHQNSYGGSIGGPIIRDKLFYFATYEGFFYTKVSNTPQLLTVPTALNRQGNFTDAFGTGYAYGTGTTNLGIFDPTNGQNQFQGMLNGVPTYNVIPQSEQSSISLYLQKALPAPNNTSQAQNYLAGLPLQNRDYSVDARLDYTISTRNKFSVVGLGGNHGYGTEPKYDSLQELPVPYAAGIFTNQKTTSGVLTYTYIASQTLINSLKYGYTRTWGQNFSTTSHTPYTSAQAGIGGLPPGSASNNMPVITFNQSEPTAESAPTKWGADAPSNSVTNSYTIIDTLQWIKGRHNVTFGFQAQWLQANASAYTGYSNPLSLTYGSDSTENLSGNSPLNTFAAGGQAGGSPYASFLIGAVDGGNVKTQIATTYGGRFLPMAPYVQDDWRVTSRLTLNLGFRYDYLAPYHEAQNRIAFINPSITNPVVGLPGVVEYAGTPGSNVSAAFAPYYCHCRAPVHPYNKNFEPRIGFAYAIRQDTVIRGNFGLMNTHAGATGGGSTATAGVGNNGEYAYTSTWGRGGSTSPPSFFLNPSITGSPNGYCTPGASLCSLADQPNFSSIPAYVRAGQTVSPFSTTGGYVIPTTGDVYDCAAASGGYAQGPNGPVQGTGTGNCGTSTQNYADPYYGGRGPQFVNYNVGIQQMINKKAVLNINYAASQTHFLPGGAGRGYAQNTFSPVIGVDPTLNPLLTANAPTLIGNATGIAAVQQYAPWFNAKTFPSGIGIASNATVFSMLRPFPQFGGFTDIWGETGNANYSALQIGILQRPWHNLSGFVNYTWSKTMSDVGNHRTQFGLGPNDSDFTTYIPANRVDWSPSSLDQRNVVNATWLYTFPIGRGQKFFGTNRLVSAIAGGWSLSGIYKYRQGNPLAISDSPNNCNPRNNAGQGTCMPDLVPGFTKASVRINGRWGHAPGTNALNIQNTQYINPNAFMCPQANLATTGGVAELNSTCGYSEGILPPNGSGSTTLIGNAPATAPYGLTGPGWWDIDMGIRRTFSILERANLHLTFEVEGDVINTTNSTFFNIGGFNSNGNNSSQSWAVCNPGATTLQLCSALAFGSITGQNQNVPPRDWQFSGRFRF